MITVGPLWKKDGDQRNSRVKHEQEQAVYSHNKIMFQIIFYAGRFTYLYELSEEMKTRYNNSAL